MKIKLVLLLWLLVSIPLYAENKAALYIGSFDMPTRGHRDVLLTTMKKEGIKKAYISVNYNTDKDFNASMEERIDMLKLMFKKYGDQIEVLREPLEGRPEFARYLIEKHQDHLWGVFGDDTYDKNFKIFTTDADVHWFDYVKVKRPVMESMGGLEAAYVPDTHEIEIDADGTSSSKARKLIEAGKDPAAANVITPEVWEYVKKKGLYLPIPKEKEAEAIRDYHSRYDAFIKEMKKVRPDLNLDSLPKPTFNNIQSLGAQKDKFVRHVANGLKMGLEDQLVFRPQAEKILEIGYATKPLRSREKAGIYIGSFDGISPEQKDVMSQTIKQMGLDHLYVGVLGKSRKQLKAPLSERLANAKAVAETFGGKVSVVSVPSLDDSVSTFRKLRNEHQSPTVAVFGENVFDDNHERLKNISNLTFAVAPIRGGSGRNKPLPKGTAVIKFPEVCSELNEIGN
jgi:phosphopantetheine adenylyltransferase